MIIRSLHDYPISWRTGLLSALSAGMSLLDEQVPPDMHDFRSLLLKARQKGVKNFLICLLPGQVGIFAKQSFEIGIKPKIGGCEFLQDESEAQASAGALKGAWYIEVPISSDFTDRYRAKHGNVNALSGAAIHYDLFNLLSLTVKDGHPADIVKALMDIGHYQGVAGVVTMRKIGGDQYFDYALMAKEVTGF